MTKEEIIKELNCCDFQDRQVLAEIGVMADGALWMQKRLIKKAVKWLNDNKVRDDIVGYFLDTQREEMRDEFIEEFKKAMEA